MGLISGLVIGVSVDAANVQPTLNDVAENIDRAATRFESFKSQMSGLFDGLKSAPEIKGPASLDVASSIGPQIRTAMTNALQPVIQFTQRFEQSFKSLAVVLTELAHRIDNSMRFPKAEDQVRNFFTTMSKGKFVFHALFGSMRTAFEDAEGFVAVQAQKMGGLTSGMYNKMRPPATLRGALRSPVENLAGIGPVSKAASNGVSSLWRSMLGVVGAATAIGGIGAFFVKGLKGAANLNETVSKVDQVFGPASQSVIGQADEMAKAFGLPKQAMLDASAAIGLVAKGAGQSQSAAAGVSKEMAKLAADASSFFNVPLEDALAKIRSGLVGESEPLRSFGVILTEDAVALEAMRLGLSKNGKELDESAKFAARASLITQGLADANGDLAKTQFSTANQTKKFFGTIENLATTIGQKLLPIVDAGLVLLNDFAAWLGANADQSDGFFDGFVGGITKAIEGVGWFARNFSSIWEIAQLQTTEGIFNIGAHFTAFVENAVQMADYLGRNWSELLLDGFNAVGLGIINLATNIGNLGIAFAKFVGDPTSGFQFEWTPLLKGFEATAESLPAMIKPKLISMEKEINAVGDRIAKGEAARATKKGPAATARTKPAMFDPAAMKAEEERLKKQAESQKKLAEEAKKITEENRSPIEAYREEIKKLNDLKNAGLIDATTFNRAGLKARDELIEKTKFKNAGAAERGSKEARSAILESKNRSNIEPIQVLSDTAKKQLDLTNQMALLNSTMAGSLQTIAIAVTKPATVSFGS